MSEVDNTLPTDEEMKSLLDKKIDRPPKQMGRPTEYTPEKAKLFCIYIGSGMSLRTACKQPDMPAMGSIFNWMRQNPEFLKQYEAATQERTEALAEEIMDIADNAEQDVIYGEDGRAIPNSVRIQRDRLRVDTRKWLMAKMKPKKYGEKVDVTSDGKVLPTPILDLGNRPKE